MVLVDANVLLYAVDRSSAGHQRARSWLDASLGGREAVGLAWIALLAFVRIGTNAAILPNPMTGDEALGQIETWLAAPAAVIVHPTPRHASLLRGLVREVGAAGNLTNDAHLAVLAIEHGADIVSFDRDFARFPGLRHRLPG